MKQSPLDEKISDRFHPSKFSATGFCGDDTRTIGEIIASDRDTCTSLGISAERVAAELNRVYALAEGRFGDIVEISGQITAQIFESRGMVPSPFAAEGMFPKGEVALTDTKTGRKFFISPLSIHLIRAHGFWQGRKSRYRLEPAEISSVLGLTRE